MLHASRGILPFRYFLHLLHMSDSRRFSERPEAQCPELKSFHILMLKLWWLLLRAVVVVVTRDLMIAPHGQHFRGLRGWGPRGALSGHHHRCISPRKEADDKIRYQWLLVSAVLQMIMSDCGHPGEFARC